MERIPAYSVPDHPHSHDFSQLHSFQAKTVCSCMNCNAFFGAGHGSHHHTSIQDNNYYHHQRYYQHHYQHVHNHSSLHHNSRLNTCTRTCFSQLASHLIPHIQENTCRCLSEIPITNMPGPLLHQHQPSVSHPPPMQSRSCSQNLNECPCCMQPVNVQSNSQRYHRISRLHSGANNITSHPPHYADAISPPPLLHASWEPTGGTNEGPHHSQGGHSMYISSHLPVSRNYRQQNNPHQNNTHQNQHYSHNRSRRWPCPTEHLQRFEEELPNYELQNYEDIVYNLTRTHHHHHHHHHHRSNGSRYSNRSLSFPYNHQSRVMPPFNVPDEFLSFLPTSLSQHYGFEGELEPSPDGAEMHDGGRVSEQPKGMTREQLQKLDSYHVTKKRLEEFSENDRCVVCMSEYEVENHVRMLPCSHQFHSECIDKWLMTNPTCPICRAVTTVGKI